MVGRRFGLVCIGSKIRGLKGCAEKIGCVLGKKLSFSPLHVVLVFSYRKSFKMSKKYSPSTSLKQ